MIGIKRGGVRQPAWIVLLAAWLALACAKSWPVEPGAEVLLRPGEGLLLVHVRTNTALHSMEMGRVLAVESLPPGDHVRLTAATAGTHRLSRILIPGFPFDVGHLGIRLRVEPGAISYAGMVVVERAGFLKIYVDMVDRSAIALDALRRSHPELVERYPVVYTGRARHEFLPRLNEIRTRGDEGAESP